MSKRKKPCVVLLLLAYNICISCTSDLTTSSSSELGASITNTPSISTKYRGIHNRVFELTELSESEYFGGIVAHAGRMGFKEEMCIRINEKSLWESGDTAEALHNQFTTSGNYILSVDNRLYSVEDATLYWQSGLTDQLIRDERGSIIGSYSDLEYCFTTEQLSVGSHTAQIAVKTLSGKEYSYHWSFSITQDT